MWGILLLFFLSAVCAERHIAELHRVVNLTRSIVRITETILLSGDIQSGTVFTTAVDEKQWECCIGSAYLDIDGIRIALKPGETPIQDGKVILEGDFSSLSTIPRRKFTVIYELGGVLQAKPNSLPFNTPQTVVFSDLVPFALSPYRIEKQRTTYVFLAAQDPAIVSKHNDLIAEQTEGLITFTTPESFASTDPIKFFYKLEAPLLRFIKVTRDVILSHNRPVAIKDRYRAVNEAAKLSESFNRWKLFEKLGYAIHSGRGKATPHRSAFQLRYALPPTAFDIQYFDEIGNISTSYAERVGREYTSLVIEPRYPMLGGWSADWRIEYRIAIKDLLTNSIAGNTGRFLVEIPMGLSASLTHADEIDINVALPAGAELVNVRLPRSLATSTIEVSNTTSWFGVGRTRTLLTFKFGRTTCFMEPNSALSSNITLEYEYNNRWALTKAICIYSALAACVLVSIALLVSLDLPMMNSKQEREILHKGPRALRQACHTVAQHIEAFLAAAKAAGNNENKLTQARLTTSKALLDDKVIISQLCAAIKATTAASAEDKRMAAKSSVTMCEIDDQYYALYTNYSKSELEKLASLKEKLLQTVRIS